MGPRSEERLAQGEGASEPMEIFHTLRKRGKTSWASRAVASSFLACLPRTFRFSCAYVTSKHLQGFIVLIIIVIMYCAIMLWYGGGSVCPEIKMTHHDPRGLLFSGGNRLHTCPLSFTLGSLRYGDYGLRLRLNMLLRMIKTTRPFIFPRLVLRLRWVVQMFRVVASTENILLAFCRLGNSRISSFRKKVFNSPALSEREAKYVSCV